MTPEQINSFFSFLFEGRVGAVTFWLRLISGIITSALVAAIFVIALKLRQLNSGSRVRESQPAASVPPREIVQPWQVLLHRLESLNPSDWNIAVIQADAIFDAVLKDMGLAGETMGERLRGLDRSKLTSLNDVWEAHKIRNRIVHEAERVLTHSEAKRAVTLFEKALRELEYLQE